MASCLLNADLVVIAVDDEDAERALTHTPVIVIKPQSWPVDPTVKPDFLWQPVSPALYPLVVGLPSFFSYPNSQRDTGPRSPDQAVNSPATC